MDRSNAAMIGTDPIESNKSIWISSSVLMLNNGLANTTNVQKVGVCGINHLANIAISYVRFHLEGGRPQPKVKGKWQKKKMLLSLCLQQISKDLCKKSAFNSWCLWLIFLWPHFSPFNCFSKCLVEWILPRQIQTQNFLSFSSWQYGIFANCHLVPNLITTTSPLPSVPCLTHFPFYIFGFIFLIY